MTPAGLLVLLLLPATQAALAQDPQPWFSWGADHRTRYETADRRYALGPDGSDQQLALRTRLRLRIQDPRARWHALGEWWDARAVLTSADSFVGRPHVAPNRIMQLHAGFSFGVASGTRITVEAGRFARDFGVRRLIARNIYRNTGNSYDGVIATTESAQWNLRLLLFRPLIYREDVARPDPAYRDARLAGLYFTHTGRASRQFDLYALFLNDRVERRFWTLGARAWGTARGYQYETESAAQTGHAHSAFLIHAQAGPGWTSRFQPRLQGLYDYASRSFDTLFGARRFEYGPTGIWGLLARSNINSPGLLAAMTPRSGFDLSLMHRAVWLADARTPWAGTDLADLSGQAARRVGQQSELRLRYRWSTHLDFDVGLTRFYDGPFVQTVRPDSRGRRAGNYLYVGTEWHVGKL